MSFLLAMPPFPGAKARLAPAADAGPLPDAELDRCLAALVEHRVGGRFWGTQLPAGERDPEADPWAVLDHVSERRCEAIDTLAILAFARGVPVRRVTTDALVSTAEMGAAAAAALRASYIEPFHGRRISALEAIELLGFWRRLIDSNRIIGAVAGMAFWKRENVEPLLWSGQPVPFIASAKPLASLAPGQRLAAWKSRTPPDMLTACQPGSVIEVEDGFIRSAGLGADCVPPFSIVVDPIGVHFDPGAPSLLEDRINAGTDDPAMLARAERLIERVVEHGVAKYAVGREALTRPGGDRRHVLVPGQVEDDRSVLAGRGDVSGNLDLLRRVRAAEPAAFIIYRPHPDIEAGHRKGALAEREVLRFADQIDRHSAIASLIDMVDAVHVLTSLAGFEALMRGREVVTHGVPFYAGWGLTKDLGTIPDRRSARPTLAQLVAAVLLDYPRYLDPVTRLPCPPEVLIDRLVAGQGQQAGVVTMARRVSGFVNRLMSRSGMGR